MEIDDLGVPPFQETPCIINEFEISSGAPRLSFRRIHSLDLATEGQRHFQAGRRCEASLALAT
jgi:hypothetical protein